MSTENNSVEPITDDLDVFSAQLFGQSEAQPEPASSEETEEVVEESDATEEDTHDEADTLEDDEDDEDSEEAEEPKPVKKSRAQERIEELNKKYRETERQLAELRSRLEEKEKTPSPVKEEARVAPSSTDLNEDGTDRYPLGEFDPAYMKDMLDYELDLRLKAFEAQTKAKSEEQEKKDGLAELQSNWNEKLGSAQERYPDLHEKGEELLESFSGLDQAYGEYLATTLMQMEFGPDVLYYLANNPDEAKTIVNSGALKATIALGRIESKFADASAEKQKARPKVSQAPTPPPANRGSAVAVSEIPGDTDDLDAFENVFFPKKGRK